MRLFHHPRSGRAHRGFTLMELLVVVSIIAVLMAILLPAISRVRESGRRTKCASNLRQFGQAFRLYAQDTQEFPRVVAAYDVATGPKAFSGYLGDNPFAGAGGSATDNAGANNRRPASHDVTAALFLLLRLDYIKQTEMFICPGSAGKPDDYMGEKPTQRSNFSSRENLTYSVANPYPSSDPGFGSGGGQWGYYYGSDMSGNLPLMSDRNPGDSGSPKLSTLTLNSPGGDILQGNSINHGRKGQNVLFADGHVDWAATPFCGLKQDNIFTKQQNVNGANSPALQPPADQASDTTEPWGPRPPRGLHDSQLLPTATSTGILAY